MKKEREENNKEKQEGRRLICFFICAPGTRKQNLI